VAGKGVGKQLPRSPGPRQHANKTYHVKVDAFLVGMEPVAGAVVKWPLASGPAGGQVPVGVPAFLSHSPVGRTLPVGASATAILHALIDDRVDADLCDTDVDSFLARNPDLAFASVDDLLGDDWA
jgi:hypothetical protein